VLRNCIGQQTSSPIIPGGKGEKQMANKQVTPSQDRQRMAKQQQMVNTKTKTTAEQHEADMARLQRLIDKQADLRKD
jgi:hypothetical protein